MSAKDSGDPGLSGWTVNLYDNGAKIKSTTTASNGSYTLALRFDTSHTYTVCEPAIAAAYAMMDKTDPLSAAVHVVAGYHEVFPLTEAELA